MPIRDTKKLAEQIASLISGSSDSAGGLAESIEKISQRLDAIESKLGAQSSVREKVPAFVHPSQDKFDVVEAIADKIIDHFENEKACTFEPNDKPCDHCSMCSTRGF